MAMEHKNAAIASAKLDDVLKDLSSSYSLHLDRDKFEFLQNISKTKYSGLNVNALVIAFKALEDKDECWFQELIDEGLAETYTFQGSSKTSKSWEGWFITTKGRKILQETIQKL